MKLFVNSKLAYNQLHKQNENEKKKKNFISWIFLSVIKGGWHDHSFSSYVIFYDLSEFS